MCSWFSGPFEGQSEEQRHTHQELWVMPRSLSLSVPRHSNDFKPPLLPAQRQTFPQGDLVLPLRICTEIIPPTTQKCLCRSSFTAALFAIIKFWKQLKWENINEWWKYSAAVKKNKKYLHEMSGFQDIQDDAEGRRAKSSSIAPSVASKGFRIRVKIKGKLREHRLSFPFFNFKKKHRITRK